MHRDEQESLKTDKLRDLHTNPKYCSDRRRGGGKPTEGKSPQICNYLFLTMVLPLGSTLVYGVTVHFQNISSKPVSATKCRLPFHFPSHLHACKEVLVLVFLCVSQDTSRIGVHFPSTADQDKVVLAAQQCVSLGTP